MEQESCIRLLRLDVRLSTAAAAVNEYYNPRGPISILTRLHNEEDVALILSRLSNWLASCQQVRGKKQP